jgi:hypothetical protein
MTLEETAPPEGLTPHERHIFNTIVGYLTEEEYRFAQIADDCLELYLQGNHLTMRLIIYIHNRHLVVRSPAFIRNIELNRRELILLVMEIMNNFFDIRFELSEDGRSLSASANHILEDGGLTKSQFMQCLTIVAFMVDENYPKLMKAIFSEHATEEVTSPHRKPAQTAADLPLEDPTGLPPEKKRKIN